MITRTCSSKSSSLMTESLSSTIDQISRETYKVCQLQEVQALPRSRLVLTSKCMRFNSFQEILHFRIYLSGLTSVPKFFKVHVSSAISAVGCILHVERDPS